MEIIAINEAGLDLFTGLAGQRTPEQMAHSQTILLDLWEREQSRPAWCFLAQRDGELIGRVGYRYQDDPSTVWPVELVLPWEDDYRVVGQALLQTSLQEMAGYGAKRVYQQVHSDWDVAEKMQEVFAASGFTLRQAKSAFVLDLPHAPITGPERLVYRSLEEVGEVTFITASERGNEGTLDRDDQQGLAEYGAHQLAQNYYELLQNEHWAYEPAWWQLAYTPDDELVGFVQPLIFRNTPTEGTIGYIGVVPEQRGHHYVDDLLAKAHQILQGADVAEMVCDTDSENLPMIRAFERAGYETDGTNWLYQLDLES